MKKINEEERRAARRARRIKNQILCYAILIVIVGGIAFGIYKGIDAILKEIDKSNQLVMESVSDETVSDDVISENVVITPPEFEEVVSDNELEDVEVDEPIENAAARAFIETLTNEQKAASLFIVSTENLTGVEAATQAGTGTEKAINEYMIGGIVYSSKNVTGKDQFKDMVAGTKSFYDTAYNTKLLTFVQEEGAVNAIAGASTGENKQDAAATIGESGDSNKAYEAYANIGAYLSDYGIDVNLGPVCDISTSENGYIKERAFSNDADIVSSMVSKAVEAQNEKGILTCLTAFPGQGEADTNPMDGVAITEKTLEEMRECEFIPFSKGIENGAEVVMMSHIVAGNASGEGVPCSLSSTMISDILRGELGFNGLVITDYMDKKAITNLYDSGEASVMAINAGADMIMRPANFEEAYNAVLTAINDGTISEERLNEALMHIYSMKFAQ